MEEFIAYVSYIVGGNTINGFIQISWQMVKYGAEAVVARVRCAFFGVMQAAITYIDKQIKAV